MKPHIEHLARALIRMGSLLRVLSVDMARLASMMPMALIALAFACAPAHAQSPQTSESAKGQVSVTANAPASRYAGDAIPLEVIVRGSRNAQVPQLPVIPGVRTEYRGVQDRSSSFTMVVNGQVSSRNTIEQAFVFELFPEKQGVVTIPPIPVDVDGRTYSTQAIAVQVVEPAADPDFKLELALQTVDAYVGQPVPVTLKWTIGKNIRGVRISMALPPGFELVSPPDPRQQSMSRRSAQDQRFPEIELNGERIVAELGKAEVDGRPVETLTVRQILVPRREGRWTIGPARVDYEAVVGQRERRFMDAPWDDRAIIERQRSETAPVKFNVRPLPLTGRPADFSGLVGQFSVMASATPTDVSVGEPIDVRVSVTGPHPLTAVPPLDLARQWGPDWGDGKNARRLRLPREPILATISPGAAVFDAKVRVRSPEVESLPPVVLNYFDPADGQYKVAASAPIALSVRPPQGGVIGGDDDTQGEDAAGGSAGERHDGAAARMPDGLAGFDARPLAARSIADVSLSRLTLGSAGVLAAVPFGVFVLAGAVRELVRAAQPRSHAARVRRAYRAAARAISSATSEQDRASVIHSYLVAALDLPAKSTTAREAWAAASDHLDTATSHRLLQALTPRDWSYAPACGRPYDSRTSAEQAPIDAADVLEHVHTSLLRSMSRQQRGETARAEHTQEALA